MHVMSRSLVAALFLWAATFACAAESPESVVEAFSLAVQREGVPKAVGRFTHPDESARLKQMLMPRIRRSYEGKDDIFVRDVFGQDIGLQSLEAMTPADFLAAFLWQGQLDGSEFKPPRFIERKREGEFMQLVVDTEKISLQGEAVTTRSVVRLKAFGDSWRLTLPPETKAYVQVLLSR
jgi:hypothetical protein